MTDPVSISISLVSLGISSATLWLTLLQARTAPHDKAHNSFLRLRFSAKDCCEDIFANASLQHVCAREGD
jgi:hypothetical protein